jgi:hypothetical protein
MIFRVQLDRCVTLKQMYPYPATLNCSLHLEKKGAYLEGPENYRAQEMASEIRSKQRGVLRNNTWPVED